MELSGNPGKFVLDEAVQGQDIDSPTDFRLAAVEIAAGDTIPGPAAAYVHGVLDGGEFFIQGFDAFVDGVAGGHGVSLLFFLKCCLKFQPSVPPPIAARRFEI